MQIIEFFMLWFPIENVSTNPVVWDDSFKYSKLAPQNLFWMLLDPLKFTTALWRSPSVEMSQLRQG